MTLLEAKEFKVHFAKHPNTTLGAIAEKDVTYLDWLAGQTWPDFYLVEAVGVLCAHYGRTPKKPVRVKQRGQGELFL